MVIIGSKVTSKATGKEGTIKGITGNKVIVDFINYGNGIPVDIGILEIDPLLEEELIKEMDNLKPIRNTKRNTTKRVRYNCW